MFARRGLPLRLRIAQAYSCCALTGAIHHHMPLVTHCLQLVAMHALIILATLAHLLLPTLGLSRACKFCEPRFTGPGKGMAPHSEPVASIRNT